jgi:hypothetical protein
MSWMRPKSLIGRIISFAFRPRASFHPAWVISGRGRPSWSCPFVWGLRCQEQMCDKHLFLSALPVV